MTLGPGDITPNEIGIHSVFTGLGILWVVSIVVVGFFFFTFASMEKTTEYILFKETKLAIRQL
jgi:hypothetical protein